MRFLAVLGVVLAGCLPDGDAVSAGAAIQPKSGSTVSGVLLVTRTGDTSILTIKLKGATAGPHWLHIDQVPDCGAFDGTSTGGHWNPMIDGKVEPLGELGNMNVAADGTGVILIENRMWSVGDGAVTDVVGHAIVVHAAMDGGDRVGCGVIRMR